MESRILEVARDILAEGGLSSLSMRSVADRVGVSATAIYHYFEHKQDLINRVVSLGYKKFGEYFERAISRYPVGSMDRVTALGEAYVSFAQENEASFRALFNIQAPAPRELEDLPGGGGYPVLRQCVVDAMESGEMREADPDLVSVYLWTCVHGLVTLALACRFQKACDCHQQDIPEAPLELFQSLRPLIQGALENVQNVETKVAEDLRSTA